MIKVFWGGIEIFDSGILGGRKILFGKYLFGWLDFIRGLLCTQNSGPCGTPLTSAFKRKMLFGFFLNFPHFNEKLWITNFREILFNSKDW